MPSPKTFHLTSLGCAKNTVDSDSMSQLLEQDGYRSVNAPQQAGILIVNTCGFISQARVESYNVLQALAEAKLQGQILIAAGCLTQRYGAEVARRVPGVDGILGTRHWMDIVEVVRRLRKGKHPEPLYHLPETSTIGLDPVGKVGFPPILRASIAGGSAYLKIADGCSHPCAFCAIPLIKGEMVSRPVDLIINEARHLQGLGVRELILLAQDTTAYGHDLDMKDGLSTLLDSLVASLPGMDWIRIMYAFPGCISDRLIETIAVHPQVLPYLDIPLQHAHPSVLARMRRPADMEWVYRTVEKIRKRLPNVAIRTTFIVGYPGETEEEFQTLLDFMNALRFDRVGAFQFSFESGTASEVLGDPIPAEEKEARYQRLMELQQGISLQINQSLVGQTLDVLIEGRDKSIAIGRSYRDAPEIDGLILAEGPAEIGEIVPVRISGAMTYDLQGFITI